MDRSGFCFGVRRAIKIAEESLEKNKKVSSLGPIIHNRQVVDRLHQRGLRTVGDLESVKGGAVLVSSHGLSPEIIAKIKKNGFKLIDTTCPFVSRAQRLARELSKKDCRLIIVGDRLHPEVKGLVGFASEKAMVINSVEEAGRLTLKTNEKVCVLSQTTQSVSSYFDIVKALMDKKCREIHIFNTVCDDTQIRQHQVADLAGRVDCVVVVGGKNSANTKRLLTISKKRMRNSHLIETEADIDPAWFKGRCSVGIASGASTPDWIIKKVVRKIKKL